MRIEVFGESRRRNDGVEQGDGQLRERSVELPAETTLGELLQWGWCIVAPPDGGLAAALSSEQPEA